MQQHEADLVKINDQNRQRPWYEAVLGIRPRAVPLPSMQQHEADLVKINDQNRQRKWYEAVQPMPPPPSVQKQVFTHAPPEVTVEGALRRARENGQRLWYDSAPSLPRSTKPAPELPAPILLGNFDGVMQQMQEVQPYTPHDLWAEMVPGTVWTDHKMPEEWVQNFGAESRAHAWEVPAGPEPRMVEAAPTVASQFFEAYNVDQRVPVDFFAESQAVAKTGSQFFKAFNVAQHVDEHGEANHEVSTHRGIASKTAADDAETDDDGKLPHELVRISTQKREQNKTTGLFFDSLSKKQQDTAIKNDPVVWVGNGNKSGRDKSMTFEFSYDNPSMTWAGLDKLWNDA